MSEVSKIIKQYRKENHLTMNGFAAALMEGLPGETLTQQAVGSWELGKSIPRYLLMLAIQRSYSDWRAEMATEVIKILRPDLGQRRVVVAKGMDGNLRIDPTLHP